MWCVQYYASSDKGSSCFGYTGYTKFKLYIIIVLFCTDYFRRHNALYYIAIFLGRFSYPACPYSSEALLHKGCRWIRKMVFCIRFGRILLLSNTLIVGFDVLFNYFESQSIDFFVAISWVLSLNMTESPCQVLAFCKIFFGSESGRSLIVSGVFELDTLVCGVFRDRCVASH